LILLDLHLPKVDGLEVLRRLKADGRTSSIPVVVLTGSKEERELYASKGLGAEAYLVKGADFANLQEVTPQLNLKWGLIKSPPELRA
jgi:CheY-like chemotaxis protein